MPFDSFPFEIRSNHLWPFVYGRPPVLSKLDYADTKTSISNSSICKADVACVTESITNGKEKTARGPPTCLFAPCQRSMMEPAECVCVQPDSREQSVGIHFYISHENGLRSSQVLSNFSQVLKSYVSLGPS